MFLQASEQILDFYHNLVQQVWWDELLIALAIFLVFLLVKGIFTRVIFGFLFRLTGQTRFNLDRELLEAFEKPLKTFFAILGGFLALAYLPLPENVQEVVTQFFRIVLVLLAAWGIYNLLQPGSFLFRGMGQKLNLGEDRILIPFIAQIARVILIALTISVIAEELGYNVNQFVAGLGIGGLALALAAQHTLSNIFAGMMIIIDKPFDIGDWIYTSSVEGIVEEVNFRTTRVRTFAESLITVPNSQLAAEAINNRSRMPKRRVFFRLGVTYTTSREKLRKCVQEIRTLLETHPEVNKDMIMVYFDQFNDSSLDILIYFFTRPIDWSEHLRVKEDINFKIMEILENQGVSVALPGRSIYFENQLAGKLDNPPEPGQADPGQGGALEEE